MNDVVELSPVKISSLVPLLETDSHGELIERLALALIKDLKVLAEIYKEVGEDRFRKSQPFGFRTNVGWVPKENAPFAGSYVSLGLGEGWLKLGFLAEPVINFLRERFIRSSVQPSSTKSSSCETVTGKMMVSWTYFSTPEGTFWLDYTYAWFIYYRVD